MMDAWEISWNLFANRGMTLRWRRQSSTCRREVVEHTRTKPVEAENSRTFEWLQFEARVVRMLSAWEKAFLESSEALNLQSAPRTFWASSSMFKYCQCWWAFRCIQMHSARFKLETVWTCHFMSLQISVQAEEFAELEVSEARGDGGRMIYSCIPVFLVPLKSFII